MIRKILIGWGIAACVGFGIGYFNRDAEKQVKKPEQYVMNVDKDALPYVSDGLSRMKSAGADYSAIEMKVMLDCADVDNSGRIEKSEAKILYERVLNPEMALGKLARSYSGPANPICAGEPVELSDTVLKQYQPFMLALVDENEDGVVSEDEAARGLYKLRE